MAAQAISLQGGVSDDYKCIHQRKEDDLPPHVKGEGVVYREFSTTNTGGRIHPRTEYYINETDKAVEFIKDKDKDAWFLLK